MNTIAYLIYGIPLLAAFAWYVRKRVAVETHSAQVLTERRASGHIEPASLHPVIDPTRCVGCGACVGACPEQPDHTVLGIIGGKAQLVSPADCIGHGACRTACPMDAISLVFGTEQRGVDIPTVSPRFETNIAGIYIAGELGGMGLIRNALEQGRQAIDSIREDRSSRNDLLDVVIVGAGPAGFAASLTAKSHRIRYVTLEQESLGGCVFQYPRGKLVMTQPAKLPIVGTIKFPQTSKEALLEFWRATEQKAQLGIRYRERVETIETLPGGGFLVRTPANEYRTNSVLLTIGRRGTPLKLGVPGEELPKVVYRLIDPEQYAGQKVLVVGGGDSALEAAVSISEVAGTHVTLSYRSDAFTRAKQKNRERVAAAEQSGRIKVLLRSTVQSIANDQVLVKQDGKIATIENDVVIISAGGTLPTEFLRRIGIHVETKYGSA